MFDKHIHVHGVSPEVRTQLNRIETSLKQTNARMTKMSEQQDAVLAELDSLDTLGEAVVVILGEIDSALKAAIDQNNVSFLPTVRDRVAAFRKKLATAAASVDITKDTPVPGADPVVVQPAVMLDVYPDFNTFSIAVAAYAGPEEIIYRSTDLEGNPTQETVRTGSTPALIYARVADSLEIKKVTE